MDGPPTPLLPAPSFSEWLRVWLRVAALSFGGPAGQIAVMHRILVDEKKWVGESRFLHALNYCTLLPGPEAQQLATYLGWLFRGTVGGLLAGGLFVLPGFLSLLVLSLLYVYGQHFGWVAGLFLGLKPAVLAVVVEALVRIGRRVLKNRAMMGISGVAFVAIFFFRAPFPLIVIGAGLFGAVAGRRWPELFPSVQRKTQEQHDEAPALVDRLPDRAPPKFWQSVLTAMTWLSLWFAPLLAIAAFLGTTHVLFAEGLFLSKTAVVTFGGAYAVLAYLSQQAVNRYGWVTAGEMLDGLGLCETTPGPLIQVVQFVAFLGAFRNPAPFDPLVAGVLGSIVATWVTFVPSFLWIFLGAPYVERLRGNRALSQALTAITAAVVGVILNLAVWFALQTLFGTVHELRFGWATVSWPEWRSLHVGAATIAVAAFALLFGLHRGMLLTLAICSALGVGCWYAGFR